MAPVQRPPAPATITEDCFAALVRLFVSPANAKWSKLAESTRVTWLRELSFAARPDCLGALSLQEIRPSLVQAFMDGIADRPGKQQAALTALRQLERWAIVRELLPRQITLGIEVGHSDGGHVPWTDAQVATAEQHCRPDLARVVTLAANTGQRGSDLVRMCPTDVETYDGRPGINVTQQKTGRKIWVPILSTLAAAMAKWERQPGPFLRRPNGRPWSRKDLSNHWERERDRNPMLIEHRTAPLVLHGLRGHACVRLKRAGATAMQIADMVGMSVDMVEHYCRFSVQRENASAAVVLLERTFKQRTDDVSSKQGR
jgi:integrase